jgi:hypothetical protein
MLLTLLTGYTTAFSQQARWVWVPDSTTRGQLKKGDVVLQHSSGTIGPILTGLGQFFSHTLVATDDQGHMRHCTVDESTFKGGTGALLKQDKRIKVYSKDGLINLYDEHLKLPAKIDPVLLANLLPGITNYQDDYNKDSEITPEETVIKKKANSVRLTVRDEADRGRLEQIAEEMKRMEGFYILHAYINMERYEPTVNNLSPVFDYNNISTNGTTCSGAIWWADKRTRMDGGEMNLGYFDSQVIRNCADMMYVKLEEEFDKLITQSINDSFAEERANTMQISEDEMKWQSMVSFLSPLFLGIDGGAIGMVFYDVLFKLEDYILGNVKRQVREYLTGNGSDDYNLPDKLANQVINTFLFNRYEDTSNYWHTQLQEMGDSFASIAVSPDNLMMAGMPNPENNFTGVQTEQTSPYNAIEDFTPTGGYYTKLENGPPTDIPVDTDTGEPPAMLVYENLTDLNNLSLGGNLRQEFEIVPIPLDLGGKHSRTIDFFIKDGSEHTPLSLTGNPLVSLVPAIPGQDQISIVRQPALNMINAGARTRFSLQFAFDPGAPGIYTTRVAIPNNDPFRRAYYFTLSMVGINNSYFVDNPIYYNQCEDRDDFFNPLIGSQFGSKIVEAQRGDYGGYSYSQGKFNNGLRVYNENKYEDRYAQASIYPFDNVVKEDKPDLSRGTCAFWTNASGKWRHAGDWTEVNSYVYFYLTSDTYFIMHAPDTGDVCTINFFVRGNKIFGGTTVPKDKIASIIVQWDLVDGFSDGTNIRFYCNGNQYSNASTLAPADINNFLQYFNLLSKTTKGGDERATGSHASIDNIIIWNKVINASSITSINKPKQTIE